MSAADIFSLTWHASEQDNNIPVIRAGDSAAGEIVEFLRPANMDEAEEICAAHNRRLDGPQYVRLNYFMEKLDIRERTAWKYIAKGLLPRPVKLSKQTSRFNKLEADAALRGFERESVR